MVVKAKSTITLTQVNDGIQGQPGPSGKTSYFHIKYSPVQKPTASQMTETPSTYIGTYVDFTQADSTDPSKYTWTQFKGSQGAKGEQGIPGRNGINGQTSYLHIAYANSLDGSSGFSVSDSVGKLYIGQYTDFVQTDSTDYRRYSWTKIKGDTGATGPQGVNGVGISSVDVMYYLSSSATSLVGGNWSTTAPSWVNGKYMWSKTVTKLTNGSTRESSPACITGEKGATGNTGATGTSITSITEEYYLSTSKTTLAGGNWTATPPTWVPNRYIWTRSKIIYKNPTKTDYTSPVHDSSLDEVHKDIEDSAKTATNFMDLTSAGLVIGNRTVATLNKNILLGTDSIEFRDKTNVLGRLSATTINLGSMMTSNLLIDTTGVQIRDKSTVLASFTGSSIELGKNNPQSVISLCGGVGTIKADKKQGVWTELDITGKFLHLKGSKSAELVSNTIYENRGQDWNHCAYSSVSVNTEQYSPANGDNSASVSIRAAHETTLNNAVFYARASAKDVDASMSVYDEKNAEHNAFTLKATYGEIESPLVINKTKFTGKNKILWSGAWVMTANHTATLREKVSEQTNGVVIVFSSYSNGVQNDFNWIQCFVPKETINYNKGGGHGFFLVNNNFSKIGAKYLYITDNTIRGHADNSLTGTRNGITFANNGYVMRYVIGV